MHISKEIIIEKIQSFLYSFYAKSIDKARINEVYDCLCRLLMEDIGKRWVGSKSLEKEKEYYILSFEYLPGKMINRNILSLGIEEEISDALEEMGFDFKEVLACEKEADLGIGDIGMGASALINELANQKKKAIAYALRYENGNLKQKIINGRQVEYTDFWLEQGSNWEHKKSFSYLLDIDGRKNKSIAYDMPIVSDGAEFVNTLRLFKAEAVDAINIGEFSRGDFLNAYDNYVNINSINKFLYLDDSTYEGKFLRLKQEYFYSVSAVRDIFRRYLKRHESVEDIGENIRVYSLDIHPTLALVEFIRILVKNHDFELSSAIAISRQVFNHIAFSITDDSVEVYEIEMLRRVNSNFIDTIFKINNYLKLSNDSAYIIRNGQVYFRNINKYLSKSYNYLSKLISDSRIKDIPHSYINYGTDRILYAGSNNLKLMDVLKEFKIGSLAYEDIKKIRDLKGNESFIDALDCVKHKNKLKFEKAIKSMQNEDVNPYSIFDMQFSIIHESKRQLLNALFIAYKYYLISENTNLRVTPTTYIFSGKANEGYFMAKETIKFILALKELVNKNKYTREKIKIIFLEDAGVDKIRKALPAVDIFSNLTLPSLDNQNFHILNSIFNMSNILTSRGGIIKNIKLDNGFYKFGASLDRNLNDKSYNANEFYYRQELVKFTVDNLLNENYSNFPYDFKIIFDQLIMYNDSFKIFYDLKDLIGQRKIIERDYLDKNIWTKREIENILWANEFRLDKIVKSNYENR